MAVQVIKARRTQENAAQSVGQKLRTCCYCRVSTDSDEQEVSYESQIKHFTDYINDHPDMVLSGVYADEGISGTGLKNRVQFNKMLADCEAGLHDQVLVKSISRWARNTVISLEAIRKLQTLGIPIIFQKEGINTMAAGGEMLITILSSLAQQESDSISKNVRIGIQYLFQQGKPHLNTVNFLGLTKGKDKYDLVIVPEEAALVRRIYREYLEGFSPGMIAGRLTADKILTPAGKDIWYQSTITSILENEKYCGDLLMQKWYVVDFLSHKIVKNEGALPQYFVKEEESPEVRPGKDPVWEHQCAEGAVSLWNLRTDSERVQKPKGNHMAVQEEGVPEAEHYERGRAGMSLQDRPGERSKEGDHRGVQ